FLTRIFQTRPTWGNVRFHCHSRRPCRSGTWMTFPTLSAGSFDTTKRPHERRTWFNCIGAFLRFLALMGHHYSLCSTDDFLVYSPTASRSRLISARPYCPSPQRKRVPHPSGRRSEGHLDQSVSSESAGCKVAGADGRDRDRAFRYRSAKQLRN